MTDGQRGRRSRPALAALAALLVVAGAVALAVGLLAQQSPPQPPAPAAVRAAATPSAGPPSAGGPPATSSPPAVRGPVLPASEPTRLDIPAIGVHTGLIRLGLNPDGTVQVPPLTTPDSRAGWYRNSAPPGALGTAVILGHVDSAEYGPAVFFRLGALRPGDQVSVTRADGTVAVFRVDRVASYPKTAFPTVEVYRGTGSAQLRLITCGGQFDHSTRNYLNNIVVYASLTGESS